jgi:hypothetical protein
MKTRVEVTTQAQLDEALAAERTPILVGNGRFIIGGSSHVEAWESSHVVAWESSHVEAWGSSHVVAGPLVAVRSWDPTVKVIGGITLPLPKLTSPEEWCAYYGVPIEDGVVVLYKAVTDDYKSGYGLCYAPGTTPEAVDWDDGAQECGGGLHFCPHPLQAKIYRTAATRYVACPVALSDMRAPRPDDRYINKIKARCVCAPIVEVDRNGRPLKES